MCCAVFTFAQYEVRLLFCLLQVDSCYGDKPDRLYSKLSLYSQFIELVYGFA